MAKDIESRSLPGNSYVAQMSDKPTTIVGYAAVFDTLSEELKLGERTFREIVRPGAFRESLASKRDIVARFEHKDILGRRANGTLRLWEDDRGLKYEIDLPGTTTALDLAKQIRRRDVPFSSFSFVVARRGDNWRRDGELLIRELTNVKLLDVSPVSEPAYLATDVALRSLERWESTAAKSGIPALWRMRLALADRT